jgi:hypothetical protein
VLLGHGAGHEDGGVGDGGHRVWGVWVVKVLSCCLCRQRRYSLRCATSVYMAPAPAPRRYGRASPSLLSLSYATRAAGGRGGGLRTTPLATSASCAASKALPSPPRPLSSGWANRR